MKLSLVAVITSLLLVGCHLPETAAQAEDKPTPDNAATPTPTPLSPTTEASSATNGATPNANVSTPPTLPPNLPEAAREIVKLAHSQVGEGVLTNFIANLKEPFELDAEQIVYLRDLGISPEVIESLLVRQQQLAVGRENAPAAAPVVAQEPLVEPSAQASLSTTNKPSVYPGSTPDLPAPQVGPAETVVSSPPVNTEPQPVVNNYNYFYDSLAPYGNWITVPSYGYVWQPTCAVVSPGWRPYWNNGGWVWSDCGWYWNSYYSWGWAPFHYGNWCNAPGYGWCWAPGSTWGPSWVTFRYASGYCGWAPLPPGCGWSSGVGLTWAGAGVAVGFGFGYTSANYCWTPTPYFANANCWKYGVSGKRVEQIYRDSTVINNYIVGNNNTIINSGIDAGYVQRNSRSEIRKVQLADASSPTAASGLAAATARPGQTGRLPVYRPSVSASSVSPSAQSMSRTEVRPTQFASQTRTSPDRFSLPTRPSASGSANSSASVRPTIPVSSRNPIGNTVALHNNRPNLGTSSTASSGSANPGTMRPIGSANRAVGSDSSGRPVVIPSRGNASPSPRAAYNPNTTTQRPSTVVPGRTEPRKQITPAPAPGTYSPVQPGTSARGRSTPPTQAGSNFRPNYAAPAPARGSAQNYGSPSFSRPQSAPTGPSRPSFNSGSFNPAPRSAPSGGGGSRSAGSGVSRPGPRNAP